MGVSSLPKTVTRQRRGCDLNPGPSAPESGTLTTQLSEYMKQFAGWAKKVRPQTGVHNSLRP